ncbi:hypothetical protein AB0469_34140 [Streptomyces sp. NPDC093801]|uniref:hypothetical protein n=1 Tax=Streptomyces sp. NPDC093801 TaxID=3155203 RepID=UPI00344DEDE2
MTNAHPVRIAGYHDGPFGLSPELLDERSFWMGHLYPCAGSGAAGGLMFGPGHAWADHRAHRERLWRRAEWPLFTIPLAAGHQLHVVYRTVPDEEGVDYLVNHPDWDRAELLARTDGHFMGPGLSWPDLVAAADNGLPGGTVADPHARLLLLLPAFADSDAPPEAVDRLAAALRTRLGSQTAAPLATAMLEAQGLTGPVCWAATENGTRINDGRYSFRNPANDFALPGDRLARVSAALAG